MKTYNGEKAIISLTSWKKRIGTVSKTLFSLVKMCPGFHIVLVLAEEEFPKKENELPEELMLFVDNDLIELLWVKKNWKSLKKVLFTMEKYKTVPIISADDDCIYICNYAENLYNKWLKNKRCVVRYTFCKSYITQGPCTLYPPGSMSIKEAKNMMRKLNADDAIYTDILKSKKIGITYVDKVEDNWPFMFHDEVSPIHGGAHHMEVYSKCYL